MPVLIRSRKRARGQNSRAAGKHLPVSHLSNKLCCSAALVGSMEGLMCFDNVPLPAGPLTTASFNVSLLSNPLEQGIPADVIAHHLQHINGPLHETIINFVLGTLQTEALEVPGEYVLLNTYFAERLYG